MHLVPIILLLASCYADPIWVRSASMLQARSDFVAVEVGAFTYCAGGCTSDQQEGGFCTSITASFEKYDFALDQWSALPAMPRARYRYAAAAVGNKIYYVGGRTLDLCGAADCLIPEVDVFDITLGTWSTLGNQTVEIPSDATAFTINSMLYVTGGYTLDYASVNTTLRLNTALATPTLEAGVVPARSTNAGDSASETIAGKGYVFGGFTSDDGFCAPLRFLEIYNPTTNSWSLGPNFIHPRGDMASAVINGKLYVIGGETKITCNTSEPVAEAEFYDPATNTWAEALPTPDRSFRFSGAASGTVLYVMGGQGPTDMNGIHSVTANVSKYTTIPFDAAPLLLPNSILTTALTLVVTGLAIFIA